MWKKVLTTLNQRTLRPTFRRNLADPAISSLKKTSKCRYGNNPHQSGYAYLSQKSNVQLLHGNPSFINYLDAIQSWDLVSSLKENMGTSYILATSFKHNTPTGLTLNRKKGETCVKKTFQDSRNIDPLSSFGDFIAISDIVDEETALAIKKEVSDGIIAPAFTKTAFRILQSKKRGNYVICQGKFGQKYKYDERELNGVKFVMEKNNYIISLNDIGDLAQSQKLNLTHNIQKSMMLSYNILRNIVSNSVAFAYNNQVIGVGAGQQNRVDCIEIAGRRALRYLERHNIDPASANIVMASDGFLPFQDNINQCKKYHVKYIIQPGGSIRDLEVQTACQQANICMLTTGVRMFYH